jgi:dolichol-phosphate mannosyltransferase
MATKVLIILPTYNESGYIEKHLSELNNIRRTLSTDYEIAFLNIDDSSPDGTALLAQKMQLADFEQIINSAKIGLGPAYLAGFSWGLARDFDYFVEMDSDGSHLVSDLPTLLSDCSSVDLVIGTRWIAGGSIKNWPWFRILISKLGTSYASTALKLPLKDLTSGYRVLSRGFLESLELSTISNKGYGFQIEIALQAYANGFSIAQVPITFVERSLGKSKMSSRIVFEAFKYVTKHGFERVFNRNNRR